VPPPRYGGTERVIGALATELTKRGHHVTLFAPGDSGADAELVPLVPRALWSTGFRGDISPYMLAAVARCWSVAERFDLVHSHVEGYGFLFARHGPVPVVSTLHGRLDIDGMPDLLREFDDVPLVAISESQRRSAPHARWVGTVHNGLNLEAMGFSGAPGDYLLFVGRVAADKGIADAVALAARVGMTLKVAARVQDPSERELFERVVEPAQAAEQVVFLGEVDDSIRDGLYASARATLMLGSWPEPFGLVAIESLAAGTPVIARRAGALPEIVRDGVDGYLVDDLGDAERAVRLVDGLDRAEVRRGALERFSASRMAEEYEGVYRWVMGEDEQ
jgi:glycosyltransferase involved in cell wall biosynthesis